MCRKGLILVFAVMLLIAVLACGIGNILPSKEMPSLEGYPRVVLVFFNIKSSEECKGLPTMVSYSVGTKLSIRCKDKNWFFDQSERVKPVSDRLEELGICACDIYRDFQMAARLAEALQADLIIVGQIEEPRFTKEESGKIEYDMSEVSAAGTRRYYAIYQTAILKANFEVIDAKAEQIIWDGRIIGYKKYKTRYRTGNPPVWQREETMLADVRKDLVEEFISKVAGER